MKITHSTRRHSPGRGTARRWTIALAAATGLFAAACSAPAQPEHDASSSAITVVDDADRTIELDGPIRSAVVANRYNSELIRAMGNIDQVVAVDANTAQDRAYWSQFDPENVIGKGQSELNLEKIIEIAPEVLILPRNGKVDEYAAKLEPAGIKVLTVTGWDNENLAAQLEILGAAFGNEEGAQRVSDFFTATQASVDERIGDIAAKKSVYWEYGDPYTTAIPGTSNDGWHQMIVSAGGVNIFGDPTLQGDTVDPEAILRANPDLILKTTSGGALKNTGVYTPPADGEFARIGDEMAERPGWAGLRAVQAGDLHLMTGFSGGGLGKVIGTVYLASWLYPDEMADIDPDAVFADWLQMQGMPAVDGHVHTVPAAAPAR